MRETLQKAADALAPFEAFLDLVAEDLDDDVKVGRALVIGHFRAAAAARAELLAQLQPPAKPARRPRKEPA